jgi:hypothetical protein
MKNDHCGTGHAELSSNTRKKKMGNLKRLTYNSGVSVFNLDQVEENHLSFKDQIC